jgi:class 3 adenylate cyclase/pimeloyl-ACP methyl ester carboxylesterase
MAELPSGTVTFLFTDLEGSTRLWEQYPNEMRAALARHDAILRDAVSAHDGHVVKTTGDGLHAVFATATEATAAAIDGQQRLLREAWPLPKPLSVRMGLHTGHAELRDGDYYGPAVNRAARVAAAPHGGQIVMSQATEQLTRDALPPACALMALGEHHLRDLGRAEVLFQLLHPDLPRDFARLRTGGTTKRRSAMLLRWGAIGFVLVVVAGVAAVAVSGEDSEIAAPSVPKPPYKVSLTDRDCTPEESAGDSTVSCQTLQVPESRDRPQGPTVKLAVVRAPATDARANAVPTVVIDPTGQIATDALRAAAPLVRLGLRGRDDSTPQLTCSELDASRAERYAMAWADAGTRYNADLSACLERLRSSGIDLSRYDQGDVADDIRDLAFALKAPQISLLATGIPTRAALVVIRRYPGLLKSVVMANPNVPPTVSLSGLPARHDESLALLARRCAASTACRAALPGGLLGAIDALRARLAADPARVTVTTTMGPTEVLVDDGGLMATLAFALTSTPGTLTSIPLVAANGDAAPVAAYLVGGIQNFDNASALYVIESCAEATGISKSLLEAQAAALPRWRAIVNPGFLDLCDQFDLHEVTDLTTPPSSPIPVSALRGALTTGGTRGALSTFAAGLSHFSLLELSNESTVVVEFAPPCVQTLMVAFLRDPSTHLDTKECKAADPPLPFPAR